MHDCQTGNACTMHMQRQTDRQTDLYLGVLLRQLAVFGLEVCSHCYCRIGGVKTCDDRHQARDTCPPLHGPCFLLATTTTLDQLTLIIISISIIIISPMLTCVAICSRRSWTHGGRRDGLWVAGLPYRRRRTSVPVSSTTKWAS